MRYRGFSSAIALAVAGCGRSTPEDKLLGWPPSEPIVPVRDVMDVEDVVPEIIEVAVVDTGPEVDTAPPAGPCAALVELGCELWTPFADACREARKAAPDDGHGPTSEACAALVARYRTEEVPRLRNPCGRLAREICKEAGTASERCKGALARVQILTERREWRHCLGDLLWFEAKGLRR